VKGYPNTPEQSILIQGPARTGRAAFARASGERAAGLDTIGTIAHVTGRARLVSLFLIGLLVGRALTASAGPSATPEELMAHVVALTAPEMEGRASGTAGGDRAARYIADHLSALRLAPGGDGGTFLQSFAVGVAARVGSATALDRLTPDPAAIDVGPGFIPHGGSLSGEASGEIVVIVHGMAADGRDDYAGTDVRGKIALILDGPASGPSSRLEKLIAARHHGAAAVLVVVDRLPSLETTGAPVRIISGAITRSAADLLLAPAGRNLAAFAADRTGGGATSVQARVRVAIEHDERRTANVIGVLPGTDPSLKAEAVVLGAHYDHLGRAGGVVHPGADDNASGTAVVLGLARAFAAIGGAPRTLVFAFFSGEEIGLLGSAHYARHAAVPLDRTVAMLNFDMVGRMQNRRMEIGGVASGAGLRALATAAATTSARDDVALEDDPFAPSDQASFYAAGVPVLFFHTGSHDDYHRPGDTADKINGAGMADVARIGGDVAERLGREPRPLYVKLSRPASGSHRSGTGGGAFLGVSVDGRSESDGVRLGSVIVDSAAARAGLRDGDIIVRLDGVLLNRFDDLRRALGTKRPGDAVTLVYLRDGEDRQTSAVLGTR